MILSIVLLFKHYIYICYVSYRFSHSERMGKTPCLYQTRALSTLSLTQKIPCPYMTLARLTVAINVQVCINLLFQNTPYFQTN